MTNSVEASIFSEANLSNSQVGPWSRNMAHLGSADLWQPSGSCDLVEHVICQRLIPHLHEQPVSSDLENERGIAAW